jgi:ubiquinone/menaquinone biosynthesis C-methylase UbiE
MNKKENSAEADKIRQSVRKGYSEIAQKGTGCCCGNPKPAEFAQTIGYCRDELDALPEGANMGLSCGNPTAIANLKSGQVVLDLGSGGGFDCFIAAKKVGASGHIIGVDMTPDMLSKSRKSIPVFTKKTGLNNVEFRLGEIEYLPVADNSIDVVISNCVINLSPQKEQVWKEIRRVLKPGGKVSVSDLALKEELPAGVRDAVEALVGCIAGAVKIDYTVKMMKDAGLTNIETYEKLYNLDAQDNCNDNFYKTIRDNLPKGKKFADYVVSVDFTANKND